jgi:hypothetical protein
MNRADVAIAETTRDIDVAGFRKPRLCLVPLKSALYKKKDSPSHQTCDKCMEY